MQKLPFLLCLATLLLGPASPPAFAKTLVVSDIDDTLKIAHVASKADSFKRAFRTDLHFSGMTELFQLLSRSLPEVEFVYVSNAPVGLMEANHKKFLQEWKFPSGKLLLRQPKTGVNHKDATITSVVTQARPDLLIYLGDNSESDGEIYAALAKKFPAIRTHQFIRVAYANGEEGTFPTVLHEQTAFVTPMEIVLTLLASGHLDAAAVASFTAQLEGEVAAAGDVAMEPGFFPDWMNCSGFKWTAASKSPELAAYNRKITERCKL